MPNRTRPLFWLAGAKLAAAATSATAAEWSDTQIGYRTASKFAEPFGRTDIGKDILNFSCASGHKLGTNFFSIDSLESDSEDPAGASSSNGAHEVHIVYRHTLDLGKATGAKMSFGPVRGPGLIAPWESNAPYSTFTQVSTPRYRYDVHPMLAAAWGIPIGKDTGPSFEGFANFIASKGKNAFGGDTARETNIDMQILYDPGAVTGMGKNTLDVGLEYQCGKNKFGNPTTAAGAGAGPGATAKTPMLRVEYHC